MGTGQTLLTIGAIMLLGSIILTVNRSLNTNNQVLLNSNIGLEEVSYATSVIQEAEGKAFDQHTINNPLNSSELDSLTSAGSLGQENGDPNDLDDFDDYNGLNNQGRLDSAEIDSSWYYARTRVHYVNASDPTDTSNVPTWYKRIDVTVWRGNANGTVNGDVVKMHSVFSYWHF